MGLVILQFLTVIILVVLSFMLWLHRLSDERRLGFLLFSLFLATWIGVGIVANVSSDHILLFNRLVFVAPLWVVWAAYFFIIKLVKTKPTLLFKVLTASVSLVSVAILSSGSVVADISPRILQGQISGFDIQRGLFYPVYVAFIVVIIGAALWGLRGHYLHAKGTLRGQLAMVGAGVAGAAIVGITLAAALPLMTGSSATSEYVFLSGLVAVAGFMLAIIRHGLFDIKLAAVRSVAYLLSLLALAIIYYLVAYLISVTVFKGRVNTAFSVSPLNIFLALILAFIFQPIKYLFDKATNNIFYRDLYDSEAFYGRLSEVLTSESTDLRGLIQSITKEIESTFKAENVSLYVQWDGQDTTAGRKGRFALRHTDLAAIGTYIHGHGSGVIMGNIVSESDDIHKILTDHNIAIIVPLMQKKNVLGYLFLGNRRSGQYANRDKKVLETISNELVIAIQNALSLQEIKDINDSLQQRIEAATKELRSSNKKLRRLDAAKDEFVSMASHQLRTPLTSVKGYISMVLEGDAGAISPMQKQLLEEAFTSSERMVHLIGDFLNVSRLQTGKFAIEKSPVNLAELIKQEVDTLAPIAAAHSLNLRYRKPAYFPVLYLDEGKLRQVVMNFIDNAIYYSPEHSVITVRLTTEDGDVVLEVRDSGIGVPLDQRAHLFTKFFRADNARRQRPDGTGVGLFLAKKVITQHGGSMVFESVEGEGSTFGFRLPIKKLSAKPPESPKPLEAAVVP